MRLWPDCVAASLMAVAGLSGQGILWQVTGSRDVLRVGLISAVLGDVDRDGCEDFAHLVKFFDPPTRSSDFHIWVLSGRDGSRLRFDWTLAPPAAQATSFAPAGDVDGDGMGDYVYGWMDAVGIVAGFDVRSGADGHAIFVVRRPWSTYMGRSVTGNVDLNGDGRPDILATAPGENSNGIWGAIYAYAHDGTLLYRLAPTAQLSFGARSNSRILAPVGDVDGDGAGDFVAGGNVPAIASGAAILMSGRTGSVLQVGLDERFRDNIGSVVTGCGDIDGDGVPDFAASGTGPWLRAFSGRTGAPIHSWRGDLNCFGGQYSLEGGADLDRDGVPDVLAAGSICGSMHGLSGRDGTRIFDLLNMGYNTGWAITVRDVRTPYPRLILSQPEYGATGGIFRVEGRILAYDAAPPGAVPYGAACRGQLPREPMLGVSSEEKWTKVTVHGAAPGTPVMLLVGLSRTAWQGFALPLALDALGLPGCALHTSVEVAIPASTGAAGQGSGYAVVRLPVNLALTGLTTMYAQWWCLGPGGQGLGALSDAASLKIR